MKKNLCLVKYVIMLIIAMGSIALVASGVITYLACVIVLTCDLFVLAAISEGVDKH